MIRKGIIVTLEQKKEKLVEGEKKLKGFDYEINKIESVLKDVKANPGRVGNVEKLKAARARLSEINKEKARLTKERKKIQASIK